MNHSVRSLLPSLLLIGIYFIADEFFGTVTGVWVAFLLGGAEFIYTRIREKVYDKMILLTTLFFCIPGLISIWANGSVLSQLQPAIIETALCLLLGIFRLLTYRLTHTLTCRLPQKYPPFGTTTSKYAKNVADTFYPCRPTYPTCLYSHSIFAGGHGKIHHNPTLIHYFRYLFRRTFYP